jgi:hypothetical protein
MGKEEMVVTILFPDTFKVNYFSNDDLVRRLKNMSDGFCRLFDHLESNPFPRLRNFPLPTGAPVREKPTVYRRVQEEIKWLPTPRFEKISSFNYEASSGV